MKKNILKLLTLTTLSLSTLSAHSLWINSFESFKHKPGHAMVGIGWGHHLPVDDAITKKIKLDSFSLLTPDNKKVALELPNQKKSEIYGDDSIHITNADLAMQKVAFDKSTKQGTYSLELITKPGYFTMFIDTNGKKRLKLKPKNELKNIKKLLFSMKHQAFAKSFFTVGKWEQPKPLGHDLEIIPLTDLSKVKVGDTVELEVLFQGKKLSATPAKSEYLIATSTSRGDLNPLFSNIGQGKAKIKITHGGQWMFTVKKQDQKEISLVNVATLTFNVK